MKDYITIIGGGLAGCEAAYQIAKRGIKVKLYEMKPNKYSPAHSNDDLAEIVCSNSFKYKCLWFIKRRAKKNGFITYKNC